MNRHITFPAPDGKRSRHAIQQTNNGPNQSTTHQDPSLVCVSDGCYDLHGLGAPPGFSTLVEVLRLRPAGLPISSNKVNRTTAILLAVLFASAIALEACSVGQQTTAPSNASVATAMGSGPESPPGESNLSQASPTPSPSQPVSNAAGATGSSDSALEIAPAQLPQAFAPPSSNQSGASVAPDAGNAQDYANNQSSAATGPLPSYPGIEDYMNQEASYEAVGTGLPMTAILPPPAFYPYYYPYFYRYYYPIYVPPPIIVRRPPPPLYAPHPRPPLPPPPHPPSGHHGPGPVRFRR